MTNNLHPSAVIEQGASIGKNVKIGPFCVIGKDVTLEDNVDLKSHVVIVNKVTIGAGTKIYPFASIGSEPQDLKYQGEQSEIIIGQHNVIREHVTINPGTASGKMKTVIGDRCLIMVGAHIAHDCVIGDNVILANNATLGGHVTIENYAILGGLVAVHQFVRIGEHAMIGGTSGVKYDVPPFAMIIAHEPQIAGINAVGLKRYAFSKADLLTLKESYDILFSEDYNMTKAISIVREKFPNNSAVKKLVDFISTESIRGVRKPEHHNERSNAYS